MEWITPPICTRGGPVGRFIVPLIDRILTATFTDMLAVTEKAARANR